MAKKLKLPVEVIACPGCGREHTLTIIGTESAIYVPCECGGTIRYTVTK